MASLQACRILSSAFSTSCLSRHRAMRSSIGSNQRRPIAALPKQTPTMTIDVESDEAQHQPINTAMLKSTDQNVAAKLYAIAETAADRAEMHAIIGQQRNNWNHLLLHSINSLTLAASITAGISSMPALIQSSPHLHLAFMISSALLFATSTLIMTITNKIQPSQLAEEQRNAARLFRQLEKSIGSNIALRDCSERDVDEAMERLLAIDRAYPLSLLPGMLEKFPSTVEPTVWWPKKDIKSSGRRSRIDDGGWTRGLEEEMKVIAGVIRRGDIEQYVNFGKLVLRINKALAITGPMLCGLATIGATLLGVRALGPWPGFLGAVAGAIAAMVNTLQHGGQVGMVFELSRNCAGYYKELDDEIGGSLREDDEGKREHGDLFEMKVALKLGRSLPELREFGRRDEATIREFAGKLF